MTKLTVKEFNRRIERGKVIGEDELVELVNNLHEENIELRKDVIYWRHKALNEEPVNCRCQMEDLE